MFKLPINPQYSMTVGTHIRFAAGRTTQQRGPQKITTDEDGKGGDDGDDDDDEQRHIRTARSIPVFPMKVDRTVLPSAIAIVNGYTTPCSMYGLQYHSTVSLVSTLLKSPHSQASSGVLSGIHNTVAHVLTVHPFTVLYTNILNLNQCMPLEMSLFAIIIL